MAKAGVLVAGSRLQSAATATTVRIRENKTEVLNGPYVETKEQLGGYYIIEVPDLDAALSWAARCPGAQFPVRNSELLVEPATRLHAIRDLI